MNDQTQPIRIRPFSDASLSSGDHLKLPSGSNSRSDSTPITVVSEVGTTGTAESSPNAFPGYDILEELGRGGMGVVYKARQRSLNRYVALKVILTGPYASPESKARFLIEAEAGGRLQHPNIVQVYDVGEHAGFSYIAFELIEGMTLRKWQASRPVEPVLAASLTSVLARAVQHAHDQGIIHRDLKPANILLSGSYNPNSFGTKIVSSKSNSPVLQPRSSSTVRRTSRSGSTAINQLIPKVTDFGLAKAIEGGADLTISGVACGTPNYMAPEQVRGSRQIGPSVDVYGLGTILYELLTGRPPFSGGDAITLMDQILKVEPPDVRKVVPGIPRDLAIVVNKCLEKEPGRRYLNPNELADDLERFLQGHAIHARAVGYLEQTWRWVRRNPVLTTFLLLLGIGFLVTGTLAVALAHARRIEQVARAEAERAQIEASLARNLAEAHRDELQKSLLITEQSRHEAELAKQRAESARQLADSEKAFALDQQFLAELARKKAESNLKIARAVIRSTLQVYSQDSRFVGPEFRDLREKLIASIRSFRNQLAEQGGDTIEYLDDVAGMSHWLGYLEYLNNNQARASEEYLLAAAAACKWVAIDPDDPEPRCRMADSLINGGNALFNHQRFVEAERCYRQAAVCVESVIEVRPQIAHYRGVASEAHIQLAKLLHLTGQPQEQIQEAEIALHHAREFSQRSYHTVDHLKLLASAQSERARAYQRANIWDLAECCYMDSITIREQILTKNPQRAEHMSELCLVLLKLGDCQTARGDSTRAISHYRQAIRLAEQTLQLEPNNSIHAITLADGLVREADALHQLLKFPEANQCYDQVLALLEPKLARDPHLKTGWDVWARAMTGRTHLYNRTGRHRLAAEQWAILANQAPDVNRRYEAELFVCQSLLLAQDWREASRKAEELARKPVPPWVSYEQARLWCRVSVQAGCDPSLTTSDRILNAEQAINKALVHLERAKTAGLFKEERFVQLVLTHPDLAPVRGKFNPRE